MSKTVNSQCRAFQQAIDVLGRPWNALILNVLQGGALRFSALAAAARGPGDKVLSARLKELEGCGLVVRHVDPGPPVRVAYELTPEGRAFGDVASAIERWGRCLCADDGSAAGGTAAKPGKPAGAGGARARANARGEGPVQERGQARGQARASAARPRPAKSPGTRGP